MKGCLQVHQRRLHLLQLDVLLPFTPERNAGREGGAQGRGAERDETAVDKPQASLTWRARWAPQRRSGVGTEPRDANTTCTVDELAVGCTGSFGRGLRTFVDH